MRRYALIYADPPWQYRDRGIRASADRHYVTTPCADLERLPVWELAARDAILALWATGPMLPEALDLGHAWGFRYVTIGLTWIKTTRDNSRPAMGLGHWTRSASELCLLFRRGRPRRVDRAVPQVLHAPRQAHSAKPPEARDRLVRLLGDVPRIELFARDRVEGWDAWGNQAPGGSDVNLLPL